MTVTDENKLLDAVLAGEQEAFTKLYDAHQARIRMLIMSFVFKRGGYTVVEDLMQETFLRVYEKLSSFRRTCRFGTWVHRIAANRCLMWLRTDKTKTYSNLRTISIDEEDENSTGYIVSSQLAAPDAQLDKHFDDETVCAQVLEEAKQLPDYLRETFVAYFVEGKSLKGVAAELNRTLPAIKSQAQRSKLIVVTRVKEKRGTTKDETFKFSQDFQTQ